MIYFLVAGGVISLLVLGVGVAYFVGIRMASPHSRKLAGLQAHMNARNGAVGGATAPAATVTASKPPKSPGNLGGKKWFADYGLTLVLLIVGAVLVLWEFNSPSPASTMGGWSWSHWLELLTIWGVLSAIIILNIEDKKAAKALQWLLGGVMMFLLVAIPFGAWIAAPSVRTAKTSVEIPLASSPQSSWPKLVIPAGGRSEQIPVPVGMHIVMSGNGFRLHNVYTDGHECAFGEECIAGPLAGTYATNEATYTNIVSYAFSSD